MFEKWKTGHNSSIQFVLILFFCFFINFAFAQYPEAPTIYLLSRNEVPPNLPKNIKEIIGWETEVWDTDTTTKKQLVWEFDKNKRLIFWRDNYHHFYEAIKYDNQNRITEIEGFYDESSSNGWTFHVYLSPDTVLSYPAFVPAKVSLKTIYGYDESKRLIRKEVLDTIVYDEPDDLLNKNETSHQVHKYKYGKNGKLIKETIFILPEYSTQYETEYTYDDLERLLRIDEKKFEDKSRNIIEHQYITIYNYYASGERKLYEKHITDIYLSTSTESYEYDFGENYVRVKEKGKYLESDQQWIFKDGLLVRWKSLDKNGEAYHWVDYQYVYFDK